MSDDFTSDSQVFGWLGFTWRAPGDWTVGAVSGDAKEGYLRVDGREAPRLELRWSPKQGTPDLERTVTRYLRTLERSRKGEPPAEVDTDAKFISRRKLGQDTMRAYTWKGRTVGYGVAWACKQCGRVVLAQVLGRPEEKGLEALAVRVLSSLEDHPRGDWITWALYDLHTEMPKDFELAGSQLRAGLTQLSFKRDPERVVIARWGMAETALRGKSLEQWAQQQFGKVFRPFEPHGEELPYRDHPAYQVRGEALGPLGAWVRVGRHLLHQRYPDQLVAYLWHCAPTNRLYVVYGIVDLENRALVEQIRDRTRCH